ncbi:MAG: DUF1016 N-terminal domain-containing protein [Candidatus Omnitrophota bacterium]
MTTSVSNSSLQELISQISSIYLKAQDDSKKQVNQIIVEAYWQIGRRIVEVEQKGRQRAVQGDELLINLSRALSETLGSGFSITNLQYMRQYFLAYPKHHARGDLPWTHYRTLLTVKDPELRAYYEKQASTHQWSSRDLDRYLKLDKVERERIALSGSNPKETSDPEPAFEIVRGPLYTYSLTNAPMGPSIQSPLMVDCGFQIFKEMTFKKIGPLKSGDLVSCKKTSDDFQLRKTDLPPGRLYVYKALVERVVDGDTLLCLIDAGFHNWTRQRLRLRNINTPEINTPRGQKAKAFVQESLTHCEFVIVKTYKTDKYDRYLADVFYLNGVKYPDVVAEEGRLLNQDLVENNLASLY